MKTPFVKVRSLIMKIRMWGLCGILNTVQAWIDKRRWTRYFLDNARRYPMNPLRGVTIVADLTTPSSLSKTARDFIQRLGEIGVPVQALDLNRFSRISRDDIPSALVSKEDFRVLKYEHVIGLFRNVVPHSLPLRFSKIVFWEFDTGFLEFYPNMLNGDTLIAMSDYNFQLFGKCCPTGYPIRKILYPFIFKPGRYPAREAVRQKLGFGRDDFVVFFNFDFGSGFERKNVLAVLNAFALALGDRSDARLLLKTNNGSKHSVQMNTLLRLAEKLKISGKLKLVDEYVSMSEVYGMTDASDVYISLHRGEGFGLGIAEAMSLGKPVVSTDYSATTEFCRPDNSIPVKCTMRSTQPGEIIHPCYQHVGFWAEADVRDAATALSSLYANPGLRAQLGNRAMEFMREHYSTENFRRSVRQFLSDPS